MDRLSGKRALITGAGGDFGRAIATLFAQEGADLILSDINSEAVEKVAKDIEALNTGAKIVVIACDVVKEDQVKNMFAKADEELGGVDILINNAGISKVSAIQEISLDEWNKLMDINLTGMFLCSREVVDQMIERKYGKIVNMSSISGVTWREVGAHYGASKAGVLGLTRTLAAQVAKYGINVNAVAPAAIRTSIQDSFAPEVLEKMMSTVLLNRCGYPKDIANLVLFLACEESSYITGECININGGAFMG